MSSSPRPRADAPHLAVIGAGVGACALVASLRRQGWPAERISLWESGRGPGGRTATRRSRQDSHLRIDHGAPLFNITASPDPGLLAPLLAGGWIEAWQGSLACLDINGGLAGRLEDPLCQGQLYRGRLGMEHLCRGLLALAGGPIDDHYGILVRHLETSRDGRWQLLDSTNELLAEADWLVLGSTLLAHPRSRLVLGWETLPLAVGADKRADPELDHSLAAIASIRAEARSNLLMVVQASEAAPWRALPFRLLSFETAAQQRWGLRRVAIQPLEDGRCAVVAHSTATVAAEYLNVYGSRSSIASHLGMAPAQQREAEVIAALEHGLQGALAAWLPAPPGAPAPVATPWPGVHSELMRWGAAFPQLPGLPQALALCRHSRVGFCGDFIEGPGFGRVEGAMRSGEALARRLLEAIQLGA
jgi:predicted NAD/FAD-dependent oxidoreductase